MAAEWVFVLAALWVFLGLINAWVLHGFGCSGWRWILICALAGPLSLSVLDDWIDSRDPNARHTGNDASTTADASVVNDDGRPKGTGPIEWPRDDPKARFLLQGYRSLSDH